MVDHYVDCGDHCIVGGVDGLRILWLSLGVSLLRPGILSDVPHSYRLGNGVTSFIAQEKF